ncbi:hypothetical protein C8Z91_27340 [Paenibacillus elgii]|uniref:N-acetyltransferase domain-containing protein n=1 Tax=Paenibacillus elgii TaxID=189691 RepID=A0A2T6FW90_9BACL|nr:GNAT family N-acetyltransferase [Paenibacillus elgii]PUA36160.1 hypothetical protein C8Z91_27340 [Paenibacillus elgii]
MSMDKPYPKLVMRKESLADLPALSCPAGYTIRSFQPGDESRWESIIRQSFEREIAFGHKIGDLPYFQPERVLFICSGDIPAATATAWETKLPGERCGYLHMVGALPDHSGRGLGYAASLAALHRMRAEGQTQAFLETDDFRLPAIKIYLKLGFTPVYLHELHRPRWERVLRLVRPAD